jgi:hypothetical protein
MRKLALFALLAVALAVPAFALASGDGHRGRDAQHRGAHGVARAAVAACRSERTADPAAFKTKYANEKGKRAFRRCVRQHVRAAKKACRAERRSDGAAFRTKYADAKGRHAFRRCVSRHSGDAATQTS